MDVIMSDSMNYMNVNYQSEKIYSPASKHVTRITNNNNNTLEESKADEEVTKDYNSTMSCNEDINSVVDESNSSKLRFNNSLKIVLIPSRYEFKEASCDLWWNASDYKLFQQSASSEIRLFALYESIPLKDARRKLYQPQEHDLLYNNNNDEEDSYYEKNIIEDKNNHSITSISNIIEDVENKNNSGEVIRPIHKVSSIDCIAAKKIKQIQKKVVVKEDISNDLDELMDYYLSLCVPLEQPELLSFKERPSRKQSPWNMLSLFGVLSLPIVGYYLLNVVYS